jgi:hypothetical protein
MSSEGPGEFGEQPDMPVVLVDTGTPKTIGVLNIVFGICLLLCVGCYGASLLMQSVMAPFFKAQQEQMQQQLKATRAQQIAQIAQQEAAARGEEEKARLRAQRKSLESQPEPKMPNMTNMYGLDDPLVQGYYVADVGTAFLLNVALLVSGIGLLNLKEWGSRLALWVAGLKIVRLLVLYGFYLVVIVPIMLQRVTAMFQEMGAAQQAAGGAGPPPPAALGATFGTMMAAAAVIMILVGAIYPVIVLILLSRRGVKAACASASVSSDG